MWWQLSTSWSPLRLQNAAETTISLISSGSAQPVIPLPAHQGIGQAANSIPVFPEAASRATDTNLRHFQQKQEAEASSRFQAELAAIPAVSCEIKAALSS